MQMHAIATPPAFNIKAALSTPEMPVQAAKLRAAGIEISKPLAVAEVDLKLAGSPLSTAERIALKGAMSRAGPLV